MHRMHATKDFWLAALRADGPAFRTAAATAGPDIPVPSCPGWSVADLVRHVTGILGYVSEFVANGDTSAPPARQPLAPMADFDAALADYDERFADIMTVFEVVDPELPAWNWAPQTKRAAFWHRRMAHEVAVHHWDAQLALGRPEPVEAKLAVDGVSEVLDTWLPAGRRSGPRDKHGVVLLTATDVGQEWFVRLRGEGVALLDTATFFDHDDHHARASAAGTASDLLLMLWGRVPLDVLDSTGDTGLLAAVRADHG